MPFLLSFEGVVSKLTAPLFLHRNPLREPAIGLDFDSRGLRGNMSTINADFPEKSLNKRLDNNRLCLLRGDIALPLLNPNV